MRVKQLCEIMRATRHMPVGPTTTRFIRMEYPSPSEMSFRVAKLLIEYKKVKSKEEAIQIGKDVANKVWRRVATVQNLHVYFYNIKEMLLAKRTLERMINIENLRPINDALGTADHDAYVGFIAKETKLIPVIYVTGMFDRKITGFSSLFTIFDLKTTRAFKGSGIGTVFYSVIILHEQIALITSAYQTKYSRKLWAGLLRNPEIDVYAYSRNGQSYPLSINKHGTELEIDNRELYGSFYDNTSDLSLIAYKTGKRNPKKFNKDRYMPPREDLD